MCYQYMELQDISNSINVIPNFPKDGIYFRDISPLLANHELREAAYDKMYALVQGLQIDYIAGIESRGFIFANALAERFKCGFVMLRKPNKMPNVIEQSYGLEYGKDILTIQSGIIPTGKNVLILDDVLATGGSLLAGCQLIEKIGCNVVGCMCLIELIGLERKKELFNYKTFSLLTYPSNSIDKFVSKDDELLLKKRTEYLPLEHSSVDDNRIVVFSHPSMKSIADSIVSSSEHFRTGFIDWNYFPDGYPNIRFEHLKYLENKRVVFIASLFDQKYLLEELSMILVLPRQFIKSLDIILPYFAPQIHERISSEGVLATAETTAKILSSCLPLTKTGSPIIHIFDLHALPVRFYFSNDVAIRMESAIPLLLEKIDENVTIVFPDDGAAKRFKSQFADKRVIVCSKIRNGDKRSVKIIDRWNWPQDETNCMDNLLIVDDMVQSGGTLDECRKALITEFGAKKVSAYVTHAVFPNRSYKKFLTGKFDKFYITNSIPEVASLLENKGPFVVLKIDNLIKNSLLKSFEIDDIESIQKNLQFDVYVASCNDIKLGATYKALSEMFKKKSINKYKLNVYGVDTESGVSPQPLNFETHEGAKNRLDRLKKYVNHHHYKFDMLISIENGIDNTLNPEEPFDFCVVNVFSDSVDIQTVSKEKTYFPLKFLNESLKSNKQITVGSLIEKYYGLKDQTWHTKYGKSRYDIIFETLNDVL